MLRLDLHAVVQEAFVRDDLADMRAKDQNWPHLRTGLAPKPGMRIYLNVSAVGSPVGMWHL